MRALVGRLPAENIVVEPTARNTAAAVGLGAVEVSRRAGRDAVAAVFPADAHVRDPRSFARVVETALPKLKKPLSPSACHQRDQKRVLGI